MSWREVVVAGRIFPTQNDGWYHLRRAAMTIAEWPHVPRFDAMINAPGGGPITWGVFFDWMLATLALPWPRALEWIGAILPLVLGVAQIAMVYLLARDLRNARAGLIAASIAAVLPGVVHYTLFGALDHDPLVELCVLVSLWSLLRGKRLVMAIALAVAFLAWPGAIVSAALVGIVLIVSRNREMFATAAIASLAAAVIIIPWVLTSGWPLASFEGLSLLHVGVLVGLGAIGAVGTKNWRLLAICAVVLLAIAPFVLTPFIEGVRFAAGAEAIQKDVAEARPLDARALLMNLTLLPLFAIAFCRNRFALAWLVPTLVLGVAHARFSYGAAIAACVAGGLAFDTLLMSSRRAALLACAMFVTMLPAYPRILAQRAMFHENGLDAICDRLAKRDEGVVWAPWWFGHFIIWRADKPVVASPFLTIGQSQFDDAARFYFTRDVDEAVRMLERWRVRYVIVTADAPSIESLAAAAHTDPRPLLGRGRSINARAYVQTVQGRLAIIGAFGPFVEIDRSAQTVRGPAGVVPLIRVYRVGG